MLEKFRPRFRNGRAARAVLARTKRSIKKHSRGTRKGSGREERARTARVSRGEVRNFKRGPDVVPRASTARRLRRSIISAAVVTMTARSRTPASFLSNATGSGVSDCRRFHSAHSSNSKIDRSINVADSRILPAKTFAREMRMRARTMMHTRYTYVGSPNAY